MKIRVSRKYHGPGPRRRTHMHYLVRWLLIVLAVMILTPAVLSIALAKTPPASRCGELLAQHPKTHTHIHIKCKTRT